MDHSTAPLLPYTPPPPPRQRRRGRRIGELTAVSLLSAALATGGTWGALTVAGDTDTSTSGSDSVRAASDATTDTLPVSTAAKQAPNWTAVSDAVAPSVVAIGVAGQGQQGSGGQGSGVVLDKQGHILTNNHVVSGAGEGAQITVTLHDGATYAATVAGKDPSSDLAVITISDPPKDLDPIAVGSSSAVAVGDPVMAVGNPLGLAGTVTTGIVSALDRPVTTSASSEEEGESPFAQQQESTPVVTSAIQTSAAVNPGNSGGALVDASGRLVGINSSIATVGGSGGQSGSIGIGFAIPADQAQWIATQLIEDGTAKHALLGVTPQDASAQKGSATQEGAEVVRLSEGGPAAEAGLKAGDLIIGVDDSPVTGAESLVGLIHARTIGSTVTVTVLRDGREEKVEATLGTAPSTDS